MPFSSDVVAVLLAAGHGTRLNSRLPKPAHRLLGKPLGRYGVDLCRRLGIERVIAVVGHGADVVRAALGEDLEYVEQTDRPSTGGAVMAALPALEGFDGTVLVLQADTPLLTDDIVRGLLEAHQEKRAAASLLAARLANPARYGRVLRRGDGSVERIVEFKDATPAQRDIREINVGLYCFAAGPLREAAARLQPLNEAGEYYLTDVIGWLSEQGRWVVCQVTEDPAAALGINDRRELAAAFPVLRELILLRHMEAGVTVLSPEQVTVEAEVRIGQDSILHPGAILLGDTRLGRECEVGPQSRLQDVRLGERVRVEASVLEASEVGDDSRIGPFAHLRPGCRIGPRAKIGNYAELKNSCLAADVSVGHFSYLGDADVGAKTNIGAGTITCNYDGERKHRTAIGAGCFIGSHATLVAPVRIGAGAYVAAGSVVTEDVPEDALVIARSRQTVKADWARRRRGDAPVEERQQPHEH